MTDFELLVDAHKRIERLEAERDEARAETREEAIKCLDALEEVAAAEQRIERLEDALRRAREWLLAESCVTACSRREAKKNDRLREFAKTLQPTPAERGAAKGLPSADDVRGILTPAERCGGSRELLNEWQDDPATWTTRPCPGCPDCTPAEPGEVEGETRRFNLFRWLDTPNGVPSQWAVTLDLDYRHDHAEHVIVAEVVPPPEVEGERC